MENQDGTGQYIWLRYATQYSKDGRTHTVEMGIPVPLGASAEARAQLLREAESGMSQLVQHVEQRVSRALEGGVQSSQTAGNQRRAATGSQPSQSSPVMKAEPVVSSPVRDEPIASPPLTTSTAQSTPSMPNQSVPIQARPTNRSASLPAPPTMTQALNLQRSPTRTASPLPQAVNVPPTRHSVGASMPSSLGPSSTSGSLSIPDFLSYIKENMQLSSKQAMDLLRVKSLSGINLREALENLKRIVAQNAQGGTATPQQPQNQGQQASTVREARPVVSPPVSNNVSSVPPPTPLSQPTASKGQEAAIDELRTRPIGGASEDLEQEREMNVIELRVPPPPTQPVRGFDEEDELEDLEETDNLKLAPEISPEQLGRAREKINALREMQGATVASAARLQALRNAADDEVSDEQLQELAVGIWNIQTLKKLKKDQVEALISWAKEDYFLDEVKAVLMVLEEERYARGNW
jgi:hypothetical protein